MLDHDLGHLCRVQTSGHSELGTFQNVEASSFLIWVLADTTSAACPAHPW